jgi:hypothetical protein
MSHFIINHPNTPSVPVYKESLRAGYINGLERQVFHKLININSCIREEQAPRAFPSRKNETIQCTPNYPCQTCNKCCYLKKWKSSNFIVRLPETLDKVVSMKLSAIEIPNTIYSISSSTKTNVFQVFNDNDSDCNRIPVEIPSGNYDIDCLVIVINNVLDALYRDGSGCLTCDLQANYDKISGRLYFYSTVDSSGCCVGLDFRLPGVDRDIKLNFGWLLGFRKAVYCCNEDYVEKDDVWTRCNNKTNLKNVVWPCRDYSCECNGVEITMNDVAPNIWVDDIIDVDSSGTLWPHGYMAEGMVDITGPRYLFLVVNDFNNNVNNKYTSLISSAVNFPASNILARISMPYGKNEIGYDDTSDLIPKIREYFGPVSIEKLHIQLVDDLGRVVDLNNNDITLLLDFQCLYNL